MEFTRFSAEPANKELCFSLPAATDACRNGLLIQNSVGIIRASGIWFELLFPPPTNEAPTEVLTVRTRNCGANGLR